MPSLDNEFTSITPFCVRSRVATMVARATVVTSNGLIAAAPRRAIGMDELDVMFASVEIMDLRGCKCGLSCFENINPAHQLYCTGSNKWIPGRMNRLRNPLICDIAVSASL